MNRFKTQYDVYTHVISFVLTVAFLSTSTLHASPQTTICNGSKLAPPSDTKNKYEDEVKACEILKAGKTGTVPISLKGTPEEERAAREFLAQKMDIKKLDNELGFIIEIHGYVPFRQLYEAAGDNARNLQGYSLPVFKYYFNKEELKEYWPGLVEMGIAAGRNCVYFMSVGSLQTLKKLIDERREYWPDLVTLGKSAGESSWLLFEYCLPAVRSLIKNRNDLVKIGKELIPIFQQCAGVESRTARAVESLTPFIEQYPLSWNNFIKPIIYNQTVGAFLCLEEIKKLHDLGGIESEADLLFLREFIEKNGIRSYDLLANFLVAGMQAGVISTPVSKEKDLLHKFLHEIPYAIFEIYQAYKEDPAKVQGLRARCGSIHQKILAGDASAVEKDPLFSALLMHVFPPAVTTQREQYLNLYSGRQDRKEDTKNISAALQGKGFEVSSGRYVLKDPSKPLDDTPWQTIVKAVSAVNKEEKISLSPEDVMRLGKELMESWQGSQLRDRREELMEKIYRYYRYSQGQTLPDTIGTMQHIMALKQFEGDTMRDLVGECIRKYKEQYPDRYAAVLDVMFKTKIEDPQAMAKGVLGVVTTFANEPEKGKEKVGKILRLDDRDVQDKVWQDIKDKRDVMSIAAVLQGVTFGIKAGKEAVAITQILQGSEYQAMQGEVTAKYEFKEGTEKINLRCVVSKRKAHGVVGLNMGVCVASDEKLWDNPNFMNVILFDDNGIAQGGMHVLIIEDNGRKYLTLPGINPSVGILTHVPADDIYSKLIAYAHALAKELKCDDVLIPTDATIHSNRSEIRRVVSAQNYEKASLSKIHPFGYEPEYSFQDCFVVPAPGKPFQPKVDEDIGGGALSGRAA